MLRLDTSGLVEQPALAEVWTDSAGVFHTSRDCPSVAKPDGCEVRFAAERSTKPCAACVEQAPPRRRWWRL